MNIFNFLSDIIFQVLVYFYHLLGSNLGLAIIAVTLLIKIILIPLVLPSLKSAKKMQELKPHLDKLKAKHTDKAKLQQAQLDLYKEHGVNPAAGCLPQVAQIVVLIALYQVFMKFLSSPNINGQPVNLSFLYLNLAQPDPFYILPILAGVSQLVFSLMMTSGLETHHQKNLTSKDKQKEEDSFEMAQSMQSQMLYMMPLMTTIISLKFHSGLILYWVISTLFSIAQQYYFSGLGGLKPVLVKIKLIKE